MVSIPKSELNPAAKRKITLVKIFGIPCVIGFFLLALASALGYLPTWVLRLALCAEIIFGLYFLWKIHSLRNLKRSE
jgi:hypothetical protein